VCDEKAFKENCKLNPSIGCIDCHFYFYGSTSINLQSFFGIKDEKDCSFKEKKELVLLKEEIFLLFYFQS